VVPEDGRGLPASRQEINMKRMPRELVLATGLAALLIPLAALPAAAHGSKKQGDLVLTVGFGSEPAFAGEVNSVQLLLVHDGKPVTDLGKGGKVDVEVTSEAADDAKLNMELEPRFEVGEWGTPGDYRADFIPTSVGNYTFHFTGTIQGEKVDTKFTSVKDGFDAVKDPATAQFPIKQPTTNQLSERLDQEVQRANDTVAAAQNKADDQVATARLLAIIGLVAGLAGLGVGVFALTRKRA
jgi:hypothetical protein